MIEDLSTASTEWLEKQRSFLQERKMVLRPDSNRLEQICAELERRNNQAEKDRDTAWAINQLTYRR